MRNESDRYYLQELERWKSHHKNFSYALTLSQPSSAWNGSTGRVTDWLQRYSTAERVAAYVCGNRGMVKEVTDLLHEKGAHAVYRERHHEKS